VRKERSSTVDSRTGQMDPEMPAAAASELRPPRKSSRLRMLSFEMPIEEIRNFLKRFSGFGRSVVRKVLRVRLALVDM
jgi:hypothetical protein